MAILRIANDVHVYGPHELVAPYDLALEYQQYLIGDIVDMANVKKDKIKEAKRFMAHLVKEFNGAYVMGNHELWTEKTMNGLDTPEYLVIKNPGNHVLLCHGHVPLWGRKKTAKYMGKKPGAGFFKRTFSKIFNKWRDTFGGFSISEDDIKNLYRYAVEHGCKTIIVGHKHPLETKYYKVKGVRIVILKRGFNEVEIE